MKIRSVEFLHPVPVGGRHVMRVDAATLSDVGVVVADGRQAVLVPWGNVRWVLWEAAEEA